MTAPSELPKAMIPGAAPDSALADSIAAADGADGGETVYEAGTLRPAGGVKQSNKD